MNQEGIHVGVPKARMPTRLQALLGRILKQQQCKLDNLPLKTLDPDFRQLHRPHLNEGMYSVSGKAHRGRGSQFTGCAPTKDVLLV